MIVRRVFRKYWTALIPKSKYSTEIAMRNFRQVADMVAYLPSEGWWFVGASKIIEIWAC